ncbi:MAG: hypothetical protein JXB29_11365 [Sedimentisphaerales bacterium]|nr:hypothetical protein [Sedimentisphaerales bacterium]
MNSRQRIICAMNRNKPDRTPRLLYGELIGYVPAIKKLLTKKCAPKTPLEYFQMDMTSVVPNPTKLSRRRFVGWVPDEALMATAKVSGLSKTLDECNLAVDEWGVWWRPGSFEHFTHIQSPLAAINDYGRITHYPWPDLDQAYRYEGLRGEVSKIQQQGLAVAAFAGSVFEQGWYIRNMSVLLEDMMLRPKIANYIFEKTAYFQKSSAVELTKSGVDLIMLGDDVAMQSGLMISIDTWRKYLKPHLKATIEAVKQVSADVKIFYHSDGNLERLIPELIEVGVDVLNPVQPECMDPARIKEKYGKHLSFLGTISVQKTMPFGKPEDVYTEVQTRIETVDADGGLILAPAHVLEPEVPWENIQAFFQA